MRNRALQALFLLCAWLIALLFATQSHAAQSPGAGQPKNAEGLRLVVILTRHGVRSPTNPTELTAYSAQPWPKWEVAPGDLTPHGALLMRQFGASYRSRYSALGLLPTHGCPPAGSVFVWADVDRRTIASGSSLLEGFAPGCAISVGHGTLGKDDVLFDPLPSLGRADTALSKASVLGAIGGDPNAIVTADRGAYDTLDRVLGCTTGCTPVSKAATTIAGDPDTGLAGVAGGLDAAGTAAENLLLEYTDALPGVGWGRADQGTILSVMQIHAAKARIEHETFYNARAEGSNLLAHIAGTIDQAAGKAGQRTTRVPQGARFVIIVGHDTSLSKMAGMLHLSWLMNGYLINDTPPGGALVFEVYAPTSSPPFVRLYFTAQTLDQMRSGDGSMPARVPVYIPGCPSLDCPLSTLDTIEQRSLDPRFVGTPW